MPRPTLRLAAAACLLCAAAAPTTPAQDPLSGVQERDSTPSDPAALGFLHGTVNRRMYSLAGAGAQQVHLIGQMTNTPIDKPAQQQRFEVVVDLTDMKMQFNMIGSQTYSEQAQIFASQFASLAITARPSFADNNSVLRLEREGELIRIQQTPRVKDGLRVATTEWYTKEGRLKRRQVLKSVEGQTVREDTSIELKDIGGGVFVPIREVSSVPGQPKKVLEMEWQNVNGYTVLKRAHVTDPANSVACDFQLRIQPEAPPRR